MGYDSKRSDVDIYEACKYLSLRLLQSYPSGDISREEVEDILKDPRAKHLNIPSWFVDHIFNNYK